MFLLVLKLYQMDVAHAILFARKLDVSRLTVRYLSAKFELGIIDDFHFYTKLFYAIINRMKNILSYRFIRMCAGSCGRVRNGRGKPKGSWV